MSMRKGERPSGRSALERVRPEEVAIRPQGLIDFLDSVRDKRINLHSFMLLRSGRVAAEGYWHPFGPEMRHPIYSVSKSVTSAAVGIAVAEGRLSPEERIVDFFPDKLNAPVHPYTAMMKVKDLLAMATVHPKSTDTSVDDWVRSFLNTPPSHRPGTLFAYDTTGTHTLCAILQKLTGQTVHDYLRPRLFDPIGIGEIDWESDRLGINKGGSGIRCTTEDLARFGQLYLQDGVWDGVRILPEGWVRLSTGRRIDNTNTRIRLDGQQGYGYQFWRCRHDSYCAYGMGGQFVVVIPAKAAVFVSTANTKQFADGHQMILDSLWDTLYPALREEAGRPEPAPDPDPADPVLQERLAGLSLTLPAGESRSDAEADVSGRRYRLEPNRFGFDSCEFVFDGERSLLRWFKNGRAEELRFGMNRWTVGDDPLFRLPAASAAAWADEKTCLIHTQSMAEMQLIQWTCRFEGESLTLHALSSGGRPPGDLDGSLNGIASPR